MGWTKRELISEAFAELALAGYDFDLSPEEMQSALRRLDTQMATWTGMGINVGYAYGTTSAASDLDADSGLALVAVEATYLNLAIRIAAGKGKALAVSTKATAKAAYDSMILGVAHSQLQEQQMPGSMPRGAGNKPWRGGVTQPFMLPPDTEPLGIGTDGELTFNGTS